MYSVKVVAFGQYDCTPANRLFSVKVVLSAKSGCNRAKMLSSGKSGCIRTKWLYFVKSGIIPLKLLYSGKKCCISSKSGCFSRQVVVF